MTFPGSEAAATAWLRRVRRELYRNGYYYQPDFCGETGGPEPLLAAAELLGRLYFPPKTRPDLPAIMTEPSAQAPAWRPFDRAGSIGWHNDFSTRRGRPVLSLSWIRQADSEAPEGGAWRIVAAEAVLRRLAGNREGKRWISRLRTRGEPFGYRDGGGWRSFRVVVKDRVSCRMGLRFYGRALTEGAHLRFGHVPVRTRDLVSIIEAAADAEGERIPATRGALLVVDNRFSLHDRTRQRVDGPRVCRRQAWLCFVDRLHAPLG